MDEDTCSETTIGDETQANPIHNASLEVSLHPRKTQELFKRIDDLFEVPVMCNNKQVIMQEL